MDQDQCASQSGIAAEAPGQREGAFERLGREIGILVETKNRAYGNSFMQCGAFLRLLYPDGIRVGSYDDMLALVRIFDKMCRIATDKSAFQEEPYSDIAGYGILGLKRSRCDRDGAMSCAERDGAMSRAERDDAVRR